MTSRLGLPRGFSILLTSLLFLGSLNTAQASSRSCSYLLDPIQAVTLKSLREKNTDFLKREISAHPLPGFDHIENEVNNEQVGMLGPRSLQQMLGPDQSFIRTPAPGAAIDTAVNLHEEGRSFPVHVDISWHGVRTSTAVYASMPKTYKLSDKQFLVSSHDYPVVQLHLHGGGTPTATGKNGMSIGLALANANIPVLALDLPGHGRGTRQLDGFLTFKDQIDWIIKIMDKMIDPNVKVIVSGHSWGAEFTAYWRRLTRDPKYRSRIARFITVSPPVDVSLGGDEKVSDEFDEWFERNFKQFEAEASPADFEFMSNSVRNGKTSTIGGLFTTFTHMDYKMPPLTDADRAELLPEDAFQGEHDIITFRGRVEQALKQWGKDLTVLGAGPTWKSTPKEPEQKTGHNVWDLFIRGTKIPFMYDFMTKTAQKVAGDLGFGDDTNGADLATKTMDAMFRNYANFFLFRQLVSHHDEYVSTQTELRVPLGKRKVALENFIRANLERETKIPKEIEARSSAMMETLRTELGLKDKLGLSRAKEELELPTVDEARRVELQAYLAKIAAVDVDLKNHGFEDLSWQRDLKTMHAKYDATLQKAGVEKIENYKIKLDEMAKLKGIKKSDQEIRSTLSALHQEWIANLKMHQGRFGSERDSRIREIQRPPGINDYKMAERMLTADRSPERRQAVETFIKRASTIEQDARTAVMHEYAEAMKALELPEGVVVTEGGVTAVELATQIRDNLIAMEEFTFCPPGDSEVCALAAEISVLQSRRNAIFKDKSESSITGLEIRLKKLTAERSRVASRIDELWRVEALQSGTVEHFDKTLEIKLAEYKDLYLNFEDSSRKWLRELKNTGQLNAANIVAMTPELHAKRRSYYAAKKDFEEFRDGGEALKWKAIQRGDFKKITSETHEAQELAFQLWGEDASNPSAGSLVGQIRALEESLESQRREESVVAQTLSRTQWEYSQRMVEKGIELPFVIQRISIREALDLPYNDLVNRLRSDPATLQAFRNTLQQFSKHLALLRVESQTKDVGNY